MNWIECKVDGEVKRVLMVKDPIGIGRSASCEFSFPNDKEVSRLHAVIELRGKHWYLLDQRSTNGSFVNSQRVTVPFPLKEGDLIEIGDQRLHVRSGLYLGTEDITEVKHIGSPNHYRTMKIDARANAVEVQEAYELLSAIYDADLHPGNRMIAVLREELETAFAILGDPELRTSYNASLRIES